MVSIEIFSSVTKPTARLNRKKFVGTNGQLYYIGNQQHPTHVGIKKAVQSHEDFRQKYFADLAELTHLQAS